MDKLKSRGLDRKLRYLDLLVRGIASHPAVINKANIDERMIRVCDAIEKDLNLQDGDKDITESEKEAIVVHLNEED